MCKFLKHLFFSATSEQCLGCDVCACNIAFAILHYTFIYLCIYVFIYLI